MCGIAEPYVLSWFWFCSILMKKCKLCLTLTPPWITARTLICPLLTASSYLWISAPYTEPKPVAPHLSTYDISSPNSPWGNCPHRRIHSLWCPMSQLHQAQGSSTVHIHESSVIELVSVHPCRRLSALHKLFLIPEASSLGVGWAQAKVQTCSDAWRGVLSFPFLPSSQPLVPPAPACK